MKINGEELSAFSVETPENAGRPVKTAAEELIFYAEKAAGVKIPLSGGKHGIFLGTGANKADLAKIRKHDGFIIKSYGKDIVISGNTDEGTLYGTYYFIEKFLGVDWLSADAEVYGGTRDIEKADIVYDFSAFMRVCHSYVGYSSEKYRERQRLNFTVGDTNDVPSKSGIRGLKFAFYWGYFGHTFEVLLPYEEYYERHPEWYSFAKGYEGQNHRYQICLTNPDVLKIVTERAIKYLDEHPDCKIISVSQNDNWGDWADNYCKCEKCSEIAKKEGYSGVILQFVNKVAKEIAKKHPDVKVHTFAYKATETPPRTLKPEKNVYVQFCLPLPFGYAITDDDPVSEKERKKVEKWLEITDRFFVWTYNCEFTDYLPAIGNFRSLYYNTVYFLKKGCSGFFQQERIDFYPCEFVELRTYLTAKLFQNPDATYEEYLGYMRKFLVGYYGKGGEYIMEYIRLLDGKYARKNIYALTESERLEFFADGDFIKKAEKLYNKAESLAETAEEKKRLAANRLSLEYFVIAKKYCDNDPTYAESRKDYLEKLTSFGVKNCSENRKIPDLKTLDFGKSPFVYAKKDKTATVRNEFGEYYSSGDKTDEKDDFGFEFAAKKEGDILSLKIDVKCSEKFPNDGNMLSWEQSSVEIFVSETFNRTFKKRDGDFTVRINSNGKYCVLNGSEKVGKCFSEENERGYKIYAEIILPENAREIGFEIMAHDFGADGKYKCTAYWNAAKFSPVSDSPLYYGIMKFI